MAKLTLSYYQAGGDVPLLAKTIPAHFAEIAERFPDLSLNQEVLI